MSLSSLLQASLTAEQRSQVQSISSMGFPSPRVARAIKRFEGDQTKVTLPCNHEAFCLHHLCDQVLDFLFLVGELVEAKYNGDSAETALIACKDKLEDAKEYLRRLEGYKEYGFQEKKIHEAYVTAKGDWDEVLDVLTQDR